jgi:hypothetical protein
VDECGEVLHGSAHVVVGGGVGSVRLYAQYVHTGPKIAETSPSISCDFLVLQILMRK